MAITPGFLGKAPASGGDAPVFDGGTMTLHFDEDFAGVTFTPTGTDIQTVESATDFTCPCGVQDPRTSDWLGSVLNESDGFGGSKAVRSDVTVAPPSEPTTFCGAGDPTYHGAGYHWRAPGPSGIDYGSCALGTTNPTRQASNGLILPSTAYTGTQKDSFVFECGVRFTLGDNLLSYDPDQYAGMYEGKCYDICPASNLRHNFQIDTLGNGSGWGGINGTGGPVASNVLSDIYYDSVGAVRAGKTAVPSFAGYNQPSFNRDYNTDFPSPVPSGVRTIQYFQNRGYGSTAGTFSQGPLLTRYNSSETRNAKADGSTAYAWEAGWMLHIIRLTRETGGAAFGHGRIEMWIGPTRNAMVKVMEFYGDTGQECDGLVFVDPTAGASNFLGGNIDIYQLLSQQYRGGGRVDIGHVTVYSHDKLSV